MLRKRPFVVEVMCLNPGMSELHVQIGTLGLRNGWHCVNNR